MSKQKILLTLEDVKKLGQVKAIEGKLESKPGIYIMSKEYFEDCCQNLKVGDEIKVIRCWKSYPTGGWYSIEVATIVSLREKLNRELMDTLNNAHATEAVTFADKGDDLLYSDKKAFGLPVDSTNVDCTQCCWFEPAVDVTMCRCRAARCMHEDCFKTELQQTFEGQVVKVKLRIKDILDFNPDKKCIRFYDRRELK